MASTKAGGSTKNVRDSKPKYLGIKLGNGAAARPGMVIVRQRGTKIMAGKNVRVAKDHTLFAMTTGKVSYTEKRKMKFDGSITRRKVANVI
ncbi:50S ribosomal protein L27 [Patescibacteria group bacterium]|nr:50S ribosomal protein L27 [Patescibacteria group bacterium]